MSIPPDALAFIIGAMIGAAFASAALIPATLKRKRKALALSIAVDMWSSGHTYQGDINAGTIAYDSTVFDTAKRVEAYLGA